MPQARLRYSAIASLDGYVVDAQGRFDWAAPTEAVHAFVNDRERSVGTYLYGRRMYEVMRFWAEADAEDDPSSVTSDYRRIWQAADKSVYSTTLADVDTPRTELLRQFDVAAVQRLKQEAPADLSIGGPTLAAVALEAGLVDEVSLFLTPVSVGGGTPALPRNHRLQLDLREERLIDGVVFLHYDVART
ncbi:dihydrofolate reductase family protein [Nostocoides sp. HKS02]|uniref:dihydrofolate reductase family protein n=1 Tax=Nostocoides sp. HKS02 TaxID=1813880 RepID=UPI0012B500AE|nr:dihydrofolate reductase family protein [Tetrasphaera sp. HKS02]QGN57323.1 deaminase [Tetrasphaera sp. HKS02]